MERDFEPRQLSSSPQTNAEELCEIKPLAELPLSFSEMSLVHLLKKGATTRTPIRVKPLCADRRLTCGSYPSAHRYCTIHSIHHSLCHSLADSLKRNASTSGSSSSSSSGSQEILSHGDFRPSPRWFDQLAYELPLGRSCICVGGEWISLGVSRQGRSCICGRRNNGCNYSRQIRKHLNVRQPPRRCV